MKRFITYVFEYDNGAKGKNVGFIKTDIRGNDCCMEIHLNNWNRCQGKGTIFLLAKTPEAVGIPIGEMVLTQGRGDCRRMFRVHPAADTEYDFSQIAGVGIRCKNQDYAASFWKDLSDENMQKGQFRIWSREKPEAAPEAKPEAKPEMEPEADLKQAAPPKAELKAKSDASLKQAEAPEAKPETDLKQAAAPEPKPQPSVQAQENTRSVAGSKGKIRRILLSDIKSLPKRNWYLCNNSFLLHGFLNYHYLIVKQTEEQGKKKYYLGVPGIYEQPERVMAFLFGFPEFEAAPEDKNAPGFGYWLCLLDM